MPAWPAAQTPQIWASLVPSILHFLLSLVPPAAATTRHHLHATVHPTIHRGLFSPPTPDGLSGNGCDPWVQAMAVLMSCAHMDTQTSGAAMCCPGQASLGEPIGEPRGAGRLQGPGSEHQ